VVRLPMYPGVLPCPRSVTEFYGGIVFFPLYQARKYVLTSWYCNSFIHSFVLSHGVLFLLVSSAIDVATTGAVGWCSIVECSYVHRTCNGYSRWVASRRCTSRWNTCTAVVSIREYLASVHATVTADGLRRDAVRVMVTADLQQMEHTHRGCVETCMLGKTPSTP